LRDALKTDLDPHSWTITIYGLCIGEIGGDERDFELLIMLVKRGGPNTSAILTALAEFYRYQGLVDKGLALLHSIENTNHSRYFVISSILCLDKTLNPDSDNTRSKLALFPQSSSRRINFSCTSLAYYGRFGHTLGEYVFLKGLSVQTGSVFATSDWVGSMIFDLNDPQVSTFGRRVQKSSAEILDDLSLYGDAALDGYDFFSPGASPTWSPETYQFARSTLKIRPRVRNWCERQLKLNNIDVQNLVAVHIRLTDHLARTRLIDPSAYLDKIEDVLRGNPRAQIFLMSDDIGAAKRYLRFEKFVTLESLPVESFSLRWLLDFYILMNANICLMSQSAFSHWAMVLNQRVDLEAWQPSPDTNTLVRFSPELMDSTPHKI